jgi:hypothetical protein
MPVYGAYTGNPECGAKINVLLTNNIYNFDPTEYFL